ncbi:MAG: putative type IV methyl-directed restriction enzyme Mrr [Candidatus Campylobacter infans]|nr:MAG: putative type IV methyl-directed restriction enzyme Mrr [Candidatus Campylobacter infans]
MLKTIIILISLATIILIFMAFKKKKKQENKIIKGKEYETKIAKIYENKGFKIFYNGISKGKKDEGIDLIAWADDEVILIQCKNHETQIKQSTLKIFYADTQMYIINHEKQIKNRKVIKNFVSNSSLNYGAKIWLENNKTSIDFIQIQA